MHYVSYVRKHKSEHFCLSPSIYDENVYCQSQKRKRYIDYYFSTHTSEQATV